MSRHGDSEPSADRPAESQVIEQREYDPAAGPDLTAVIMAAVAAAEGVDLTSIKEPPLYEVVDITAVHDALFSVTESQTSGMPDRSIDFEYRDFRITVRSDGWVQVENQAD